MAHAVILVSDTHTGSRYGLWPEGATDDEGAKPELNVYQQYLWDCWQHAWDVWLPATIGPTQRLVVHGGDATEGNHHGGSGLVCSEVGTQVAAAVTLLEKRMTKPCIMVSGTEAHAGLSAQWDNLVAMQLGARQGKGDRYAQWEAWVRIDDVLLNIAHHMRGATALISALTPLVAEWNDMVHDAGLGRRELPNVIIRAHQHRYRKIEPDDTHAVIALPAWQAKTPYVYKLTRRVAPDIGMVVILTDGGKFEIHSKTYAWPKPLLDEVEEDAWTPIPNPSSPMKTGPSFLERLRGQKQATTVG